MQKTKLDEKADELRRQIIDDEMQREIDGVEDKVLGNYTFADAMREGSSVTDQAFAWGITNNKACAMTAAMISLKARDLA